MAPIDVTSALAAEHTRDLTRTAERSRLAALAACCRPAAWGRAASHLAATARRIAAADRTRSLPPGR
jgi:RecB family endonuclease NucS